MVEDKVFVTAEMMSSFKVFVTEEITWCTAFAPEEINSTEAMSHLPVHCHRSQTRPQGYKKCCAQLSAEHEIFPAHKMLKCQQLLAF